MIIYYIQHYILIQYRTLYPFLAVWILMLQFHSMLVLWNFHSNIQAIFPNITCSTKTGEYRTSFRWYDDETTRIRTGWSEISYPTKTQEPDKLIHIIYIAQNHRMHTTYIRKKHRYDDLKKNRILTKQVEKKKKKNRLCNKIWATEPVWY